MISGWRRPPKSCQLARDDKTQLSPHGFVSRLHPLTDSIMNKEGRIDMKYFLPILLLCFVSTGAHAQQSSVAKEIIGYRDISVGFSESAEKCNLKDAELFKNHLRTKLAEIGIVQRDDVYGAIGLGISGKDFGAIGGHCVTMVEINFNAMLGKDNIVTSDQRLREAIDRLERIPLTVYKDSAFAVQPQSEPSAGGETTKSQEAALGMIDTLVENLKAKRE
jgi:hypothetical protein